MRAATVSAFALAIAAVLCGLGTGAEWPLYLRILAGVLALTALAGASEVTRDDVVGWSLAASVGAALLASAGALASLTVPGVPGTPPAQGLLVLAACGGATVALAVRRAQRSRPANPRSRPIPQYHPQDAVDPAGGGRRRDRRPVAANARARGLRRPPGQHG